MLQVEQILQERYQLQRQLGRTAAGRQTWLALDLQTQEFVTVKLLAFSPQMQWEELKLFEREAQVLQALDRPQIPRYRDYFSIDQALGGGVPWFGLVQDYIPGHSLQELLEQGQHFSEKQVRQIAIEVLEILIYLHELSPPVLHRDIKPSNLILGEDKRVYLVDFGAVQAQAAVTGVTFTVVGTSGYAPLEQFWGRAVPASDLYALGATLIHLLTGVSPAELPQKDSKIQFADRVSINRNFVNWIETMTEIAVEKRFAQARLALEMLKSNQGWTKLKSKGQPLLRKLYKPSYTRIQLERSPTELEIVIPELGFNLSSHNANGVGCSGLFIGYFIFALTTAISRHWPGLGLLFIVLVLVRFAIASGQRTTLRLGRDSLELKRQLWGWTYIRHQEDLNQVFGVFLQGRQAVKIMIQTPVTTYYLGRSLGNQEAAWLAQEIQHWLNYRSE
ncbi:serine/threonine protein kinase [Desertifilum sp. FACHB-1129]|uniref:Serine/threonine protein kinase n=1 Tax=Desertifilum tharense IPPAS B-1220 TaxID=1781255 RepID=A0A1E5QKV9_9CYAN|nr:MULTISPECIES: serine/threonine-protein kinase [Desertifilum]MDA0211761.1 serine/threonine-protein kinase [Cyanobacteria bacterium FC1]MBD2311991.1 serine/threonine protein kinase [Desertifilum sp. FACHB-1129]MBD2322443.1 serine/threonine protein kinase [Desertifilum sp. FACHB-866]MBD2332606.1 serine/threonine protein kinase [Desertifilum sp. FACHB-868]OEJ75315.1 serine/threonine protein kinase [Desertifilum tharense IPPAS B-1220]